MVDTQTSQQNISRLSKKSTSIDQTRTSTNPGSASLLEDSEVDEDELQDHIEEDAPAKIQVKFTIKVNSVKEVLLMDGVPVYVSWIYNDKSPQQTPNKQIQGNQANFGTSMQMNTTLRKHKTKLRYERKELTMILIQADN